VAEICKNAGANTLKGIEVSTSRFLAENHPRIMAICILWFAPSCWFFCSASWLSRIIFNTKVSEICHVQESELNVITIPDDAVNFMSCGNTQNILHT